MAKLIENYRNYSSIFKQTSNKISYKYKVFIQNFRFKKHTLSLKDGNEILHIVSIDGGIERAISCIYEYSDFKFCYISS